MGPFVTRSSLLLGLLSAACFGKPPYPGAGLEDGGGSGTDGRVVDGGPGLDVTPPCSGCVQVLTLDKLPPGSATYSDVTIPVFFNDQSTSGKADPGFLADSNMLTVTDNEGNSLAFEVELGRSGPPVLWVRVPLISRAVPTTLTLRREQAGTGLGPAWRSTYWGVWHMSSMGTDQLDSTVARKASPYMAATAPDQGAGPFGDAVGPFSAQRSLAVSTHMLTLGAVSAYTISAWVRVPAAPSASQKQCIVGQPSSSGLTTGNVAMDVLQSDRLLRAYWVGGDISFDSKTKIIETTRWHYVAFSTNTGKRYLVIDDALVNNQDQSAASPKIENGPNNNLFLGSFTGSDFALLGALDEVRVELSLRTPDDLALEYRAQSDNLITYGPVQ